MKIERKNRKNKLTGKLISTLNINLRKSIQKLMVMVLAIAMASCMVFADTVYTDGLFKYIVENDSVTIVEYFGSDEEVTVPSAIAGRPVSSIGENAFTSGKAKKVVLPDTIMTIKEGAFSSDIEVVYSGLEKGSDENELPEIPADTNKKDDEKDQPDENTQANTGANSNINTENRPDTSSTQNQNSQGNTGSTEKTDTTENTDKDKNNSDSENKDVKDTETEDVLSEKETKNIGRNLIIAIAAVVVISITVIFLRKNKKGKE